MLSLMRGVLAVLMVAAMSVHSEEFTDEAGITWYYNVEDGGAVIFLAANASGAVSVPSELNGTPVRKIMAYPHQQVFGWGNSTVTSLTIPSGVTHILPYSFNRLQGLVSLTLPETLTHIGEGAFFDNWSLTNVVIPNSVTSIGQYAFRNSYNLATITFGNGVNYIGPEALRDCANLRQVRFLGDAPTVEGNWDNCPAYVLRESGTSGWGSIFAGRPVFSGNGDLNNDGVSDVQAIALGYEPTFNFLPFIDYIKTNSVFRSSLNLFTTNQIHNLGLGGIVLNRNTNNQLVLNYQILQSADLQSWLPYQQTELVISNASSDKMFLRVLAVENLSGANTSSPGGITGGSSSGSISGGGAGGGLSGGSGTLAPH